MIETITEYFHGHECVIQVHTCDDCGWRVEDLADRIDIEWWSDNRCGCFKEVDA